MKKLIIALILFFSFIACNAARVYMDRFSWDLAVRFHKDTYGATAGKRFQVLKAPIYAKLTKYVNYPTQLENRPAFDIRFPLEYTEVEEVRTGVKYLVKKIIQVYNARTGKYQLSFYIKQSGTNYVFIVPPVDLDVNESTRVVKRLSGNLALSMPISVEIAGDERFYHIPLVFDYPTDPTWRGRMPTTP